MLGLLARYSHAIQIHRTHEHIREIQDCVPGARYSQHYVRRPVASFYRGAIGLGDEPEGARHAPALHGDLGSVLPGVSGHHAGL